MQREARVAAVVGSLERELQLIAVTGVEDRLQVRAVLGCTGTCVRSLIFALSLSVTG